MTALAEDARPKIDVLEPGEAWTPKDVVDHLVMEYRNRPDQVPGRPKVRKLFAVREHEARWIVGEVRRALSATDGDEAEAAGRVSSTLASADEAPLPAASPRPAGETTQAQVPSVSSPELTESFASGEDQAAPDVPRTDAARGTAESCPDVEPDSDKAESEVDEATLPATPEPQPSEQAGKPARQRIRASTVLFILGAAIGIIVSFDTSWRFFEEKAGVENLGERAAMFAGLEVLLIACGVTMFENVRGGKNPGAARWLAWAICIASGYIALLLSGPIVGPARVVLGPVLSVVSFHMALGIELRHARSQVHAQGLLAQALSEFKQWVGSWIGLSQQDRPAAVRRQQRQLRRAANLSESRWRPFHTSRLRRALHRAGVAHDRDQRQLLLEEKAVLASAKSLRSLNLPSPWETPDTLDDAPNQHVHRRTRARLRLRQSKAVVAGHKDRH